MKLEQLFENVALGTRFTPGELEIVYDALLGHNEELDISDVKSMAQAISEREDWDRNVGSAKFAIARMHVLFHGVAPHGVTERTAEKWMIPSKPMDEFAKGKGINVDTMVSRAQRELKGRKIQVSYEDAKKQIYDHFVKVIRPLGHSSKEFDRDILVQDVMKLGLSAEEAFDRRYHIRKSHEAA